jgi:hypothetical protein
MQSRTKSKTTKPREEDKEQSAQFIATARELDVDETGKEFEKTLAKILPPRQVKKS